MPHRDPDSPPLETAEAVVNGVDEAQGEKVPCAAQNCSVKFSPGLRSGARQRFCSDACRMRQWAIDHPRKADQVREAVENLRPRPGSSIKGLTISVPSTGQSVTLNQKEGDMAKQLPITKPTPEEYQRHLERFYEAVVGLQRLENEKRQQAKAYNEEIQDQRKYVLSLEAQLEDMKAALEVAA